MKERIVKHLMDNYCVKFGHPNDNNGAVKHLIYSIVAPKNGGCGRGEMSDHAFVNRFLLELADEGEILEYTTELSILVIECCNEFTESFYNFKK